MHKLEKAAEYADYLVQTARHRPERLLDSSTANTKWKSIHQKLIDLYLEESKKQAHDKHLKCTSHLLAKLVKKDSLNTLVVKLYPGNEGYSLMLRGRTGADSETIRLPYEESELLDYIDAEELPPILVDLLDKSKANIFYSGCVIIELRDFRRATNGTWDTRYVLLKPTPHTLLCDINTMTNDGHRWTQEDKFQLESLLLLHTNEPLCLDPSPSVFFATNKLNFEKHKFNSHALKRSVKKFSQASVNRKRKMAQCPAPKYLKLHDFLIKKKDKLKTNPPFNLKVGKTCVDMWRQREVQLNMPEVIDVAQYAKSLEMSKLTLDNSAVVVEEHIYEREKSHGKVNFSRLKIRQRLSDEFYLGELYVDGDYVESQSHGSTCKFSLGTRANVDKYIHQFQEIFTEEGRRQVKITHLLPGQNPVITYTQTHHTPQATTPGPQTGATTTQALLTQATNLAAGLAGQGGGQISIGPAGDGKSKQLPIRVSLNINPAGAAPTLVSPGATAGPVDPQVAAQAAAAAALASGQVTLNLHQPQQQLTASQRIRQMGFTTAQPRPVGTPSPVSTPVGGHAPQLPTYSQATAALANTIISSGAVKAPTPAPTPPPPSLAGSAPGSRRSSITEVPQMTGITAGSVPSNIQGQSTAALQSSSAPSTPSTPTPQPFGETVNPPNITLSVSTASSLPGGSTVPGGITMTPHTITMSNLAGVPQNINIQNLAGLQGVGVTNIQGLQNLQNVQVSSLPGGAISLPLPIGTMINANSQGNILVSSLTNVPSGATTSSPVTATASGGNTITQSGAAPSVTSPPTFVTMVTAVPQTVSSTSGTPVTSSLVTTPTTMISTPQGMISLPIGSLTQFMTATGLKGAPGLRHGTPLVLSQIPGQPSVQLLTQARAQLGSPQGQPMPAIPGLAAGKQTPVTTALLTPQNLTQQQSLGALSQMRQGQPGPALAPQLMQLNPQQQMMHPLTLQKHQLQQLQIGKPAGGSTGSGGGGNSSGNQSGHPKSKSKKRTSSGPKS